MVQRALWNPIYIYISSEESVFWKIYKNSIEKTPAEPFLNKVVAFKHTKDYSIKGVSSIPKITPSQAFLTLTPSQTFLNKLFFKVSRSKELNLSVHRHVTHFMLLDSFNLSWKHQKTISLVKSSYLQMFFKIGLL